MTSLPIDVEDLRAHAGWMRRLARSLVRDEAVADDLVQEACSAALTRAPRAADEGALRAWLARVVRNAALRRRRGETRRARRERAAARPEGQPSAAALVERLEVQRALAEALLELEEPFRSTLVARYLDERSAADLARALGVPAATVRWRVQRGLALLRERLDRRHGDRTTWTSALAPLLGPPALSPPLPGPAGGATTLLTGALAMKTLVQVGAVAALVGVAALSWSVLGGDGGGATLAEREAAPRLVADAPTLEPARGTALEATPAAADERAAARAPADAVADDEPAPPEAAPRRGAVHARFVDLGGQPLAGVHLEADGERTTSDEGGEAALDLVVRDDADERDVQLIARHPACATFRTRARVRPGETTWLGTLELAPGGAVAGRVLDAGRRPVAGAEIEVTQSELPPGELDYWRLEGPHLGRTGLVSLSGADGTFRVEGVPAGASSDVRVWARTEGTRWTVSAPQRVVPGGEAWVGDLALEPLAREEQITGRVVGPDGAPIANASMPYRYVTRQASGSSSPQADGRGEFRIVLPLRGEHWLGARDPEGRYAAAPERRVEPGEHVELRLGELLDLVLRVSDPEGRPVERFAVRVAGVDELEAWENWPISFAGNQRDHEGGRVSLRVPDEPFTIGLRGAGWAPLDLGPFDPAEELPAELACTLEPVPALRGLVLAGGEPLAGAQTQVVERFGEGTVLIRNGFRTWLQPDYEAHAQTDARGRFVLPMREDVDDLLVRVTARGFAPTEVAFVPGDELVIELGRGGALEGRVLLPPGRDPTGLIVGANRGDADPWTRRVGPDGSYRFEGLAPGPWEVRLCEQEVTSSSVSLTSTSAREPVPWPWTCEVREGETTFHDLDLRDELGAVLAGRVDADGALEGRWTASLWRPMTWGDADREEVPSAELARDGSFELPPVSAGRWNLLLRRDDGAAWWSAQVDLEPGRNPWTLAFECADVVGTVTLAAAGDDPQRYLIWRDPDGDAVLRAALRPDATGRFELTGVPAGKARIVHRTQGASQDPQGWDTLRELELEAGVATRVDLP